VGIRRSASLWMPTLLVAGVLGLAGQVAADPPDGPDVLTVERAVAWALQHNPDLAVARKQRGIAEANVVIARTYPFNPLWQNFTLAAGGPAEADIRNRVFVENTFRLDLELRGQGKIRGAAAAAALSRTEWDIATQELAVAVRVLRAFNTFDYRQEKLQLLEDTVQLQEQTVQKVKRLAEQGKLRPADLMLASSDLVEARAQRGPSQALRAAAWNDLRRAIGVDRAVSGYRAQLDPGALPDDVDTLTQLALHTRPDLKALDLALVEAEQRVRLEVANRFGNPSVGPAMEYNETRITFVGAWLVTPLPILNTRRGEIQLRQAERDRVWEDKRRVETLAALDVKAAVARLREARQWVNYFGSESLPALQKTMEDFETLFTQGEPGVDVLRLIDARRRLLRAKDGYLDALWELNQARADLVAATGDLTLAVCPPEAPSLPDLPDAPPPMPGPD
jgi:outer membrane protein, heavy metal efflux system